MGWQGRELAREAGRVTGGVREGDLNGGGRPLVRADALARVIDGATPLPPAVDPAGLYRRYKLHDFLLAQARPSLDAAWDDVAGVRPYAEGTPEWFAPDARPLILPADVEDSDTKSPLPAHGPP